MTSLFRSLVTETMASTGNQLTVEWMNITRLIIDDLNSKLLDFQRVIGPEAAWLHSWSV